VDWHGTVAHQSQDGAFQEMANRRLRLSASALDWAARHPIRGGSLRVICAMEPWDAFHAVTSRAMMNDGRGQGLIGAISDPER
jgi:hypothetical protein